SAASRGSASSSASSIGGDIAFRRSGWFSVSTATLSLSSSSSSWPMGSSGDECAAIVPSPWAAGAARRPPGPGRLLSDVTLVCGSHVPLRGLEVTSCRGVRGVAPEKLLEFAHGFAIEAVAAQEGPEVVTGENIARLELEDLAVRGDRLVGPSLPLIRESQVGLDDDRLRSHLDGLLEFRDGLLQLPLIHACGHAVV